MKKKACFVSFLLIIALIYCPSHTQAEKVTSSDITKLVLEANNLYNSGKYKEAAQLNEKALKLARENNIPLELFNMYLNLGYTYGALKDYGSSGKYLYLALNSQEDDLAKGRDKSPQLKKQAEDYLKGIVEYYPESYAVALFKIGMGDMRAKRYKDCRKRAEEAIQYFNKSEVLKETDKKYYAGLANRTIATSYMYEKNTNKAIEHYEKAQANFEKTEQKEEMARNLYDLGFCYKVKEPPDKEKAGEYYEQALSILEEIDVEKLKDKELPKKIMDALKEVATE